MDWNKIGVTFLWLLCRSHPTRVRGLKYFTYGMPPQPYLRRTLHGCVDWNLCISIGAQNHIRSHPTRVRGLKFNNFGGIMDRLESHPTRVRGLKSVNNYLAYFSNGRTLHGCVDWNIGGIFYLLTALCRTLHGCVDWNPMTDWKQLFKVRRTLHGCVDWNLSF